ncbi:IS66 family insertion sequence element accessory protein TnpA [Haloferula sp.]|uniref:IS66 family insertion sequence element accessory protein TnpA n=1 Tax=Haloferula sp. TaxID=2497595 RepID=UPI003C7538DF
MASTSDSTSIIKSVCIGRTRYSAEYKAEVVAAFEGSGLSGPAFAKQCGIKYPAFAAWVAKDRKESGPPSDGRTDQHFLLAVFAGLA